jgi:site-specific DNA-methyltransferase (adenine-specific)
MNYTLHQGDALAYIPTMEAWSIDAIVTDPPYSSGGAFRSDRNLAAREKYQQSETVKEYPEFAGDNRDQRAYLYWCALWLEACLQVIRPGGICCLFTDWRQIATTIDALQVGGFVWRGIVPWNKTAAVRPGLGRFRAQCEYVVWGSAGPISDRVATCLPGFFSYPVKPNEKRHVTGKPLSLMIDIIKITLPGDVIFDPFMGSGTTGIAAVQTGRSFIGCEIDPHYYAIAKKRIGAAAGQGILFSE